MKIIDLLNKIANKEEVPNIIVYDKKIMKFSSSKQDYRRYYDNGNGDYLFQYLFDKCRDTSHFINDYVKIIDCKENLKVKIIKSSGESYWYSKKIGEIFDVSINEFGTLTVIDKDFFNNYYIDLCDCEIIEETEKPKEIAKITMCTSRIMGFDGVENITTELKNKINELTDAVNYLLKQEKK